MSNKQVLVLVILSAIALSLFLCLCSLLLARKGDEWPPVNIVVESWSIETTQRFDWWPIEPGHNVVVTNIAIINKASLKDHTVYANLFFLEDDTGRRYGYDGLLTAEVNNNIAGVGGTMAPGETIRGNIAFPIPQGVKPANLIYEHPAYKIKVPITKGQQ